MVRTVTPPKVSIPRAGAIMVAVLLLQLAFIGSYVGALHDPTPHDVPVAIVGLADNAESQGQAQGLAQALNQSASGVLATVTTADDATAGISDRSYFAAYSFGETQDTVTVASANNPSVSSDLSSAFQQLSEQLGRTVVEQDAHPLPDSDPRGLGGFYLVVGWVVGGYLVATALGLLRGMAGATRKLALFRTAAFAGYGLVSGLLGALLVGPIMDVLPGPFWSVALVGALLSFAVTTFTAALQSALGIAGTGLAIVLFVVLGNPSSGGPFPWELLPGFWANIGPFIPTGAATEIVRSVLYFDGTAIGGSIITLFVYALLGVIGMIAFAHGRLPLDGSDPLTKDGSIEAHEAGVTAAS